jgi:hypothetical protein
VTVESGRRQPQSRRVTVEVQWQADSSRPDWQSGQPLSVRLTTVLSARTVKKAGGAP